MSKIILAQKGNHKKKFSAEAWELLNDKNGWVMIEEIVIGKISKPIPDSGTKKTIDVVENLIPEKPQEQPVTNEQLEADASVTEAIPNVSTVTKEFSDYVTAQISKSQIKDYLDAENISYKNSMSFKTLVEILSLQFSNNLFKLKNAFNISEL